MILFSLIASILFIGSAIASTPWPSPDCPLEVVSENGEQKWLIEINKPLPISRLNAGVGWKAATAEGVKVPIGMSPDVLQKFISTVASDPAFSKVDVIVGFGSRTHFEMGHRPGTEPISDLDIAAFFQDRLDLMTRFDASDAINTALAPLSKEAGFEVNEEIPAQRTVKEALAASAGQETFPVRTREEEAAIWNQLVERGRAENWDRNRLKKEYDNVIAQNADGPTFLKDDLIIIRPSPRSKDILAQLLARGFTNILILE